MERDRESKTKRERERDIASERERDREIESMIDEDSKANKERACVAPIIMI
jgi:hypothetical protein